MMTKADLRRSFLEKRIELSDLKINAMSSDIGDRFFESVDLTAVTNLHVFIRIPRFNEIDTSQIYSKLWLEFPRIRTIAPRTSVSGAIVSVFFNSKTSFTENTWGIPEPANGDRIDAGAIDLVLVPLLCFDKIGHRVGYGKGIYDRYLSGCRTNCQKVGLSYFPPVDKIDDVAEFDVMLDVCVTPTGVYRKNPQTQLMQKVVSP